LFVTGRDLEEKELALQWDAEFGLWTIAGEAAEFRMSKERAEVIALLKRMRRPMKPSEIADALGTKAGAIRSLLWDMSHDGQVFALGRGHYGLASGNAGNGGNAGNAGNAGNGPVPGSRERGNADEDRDAILNNPFD